MSVSFNVLRLSQNNILLLFLTAGILSATASEPPPMPKDCLADPDEVIRVAEDVTTKRFPNADVVMLDDRLHSTYEPDGTGVFWDDEWVKILTEKGRRAYAALSLSVTLRYGDAAIELVEIIGTNGVARTVDFRRTLKMATDNSSTSANIYDPLDKKISCSIPGLAVGEIRHVRYCRRTLKPRMKGTWADTLLMEFTYPILRTVVSVDQPDARPVRQACGYAALAKGLLADDATRTAVEELVGLDSVDDGAVANAWAALREQGWEARIYGHPAFQVVKESRKGDALFRVDQKEEQISGYFPDHVPAPVQDVVSLRFFDQIRDQFRNLQLSTDTGLVPGPVPFVLHDLINVHILSLSIVPRPGARKRAGLSPVSGSESPDSTDAPPDPPQKPGAPLPPP